MKHTYRIRQHSLIYVNLQKKIMFYMRFVNTACLLEMSYCVVWLSDTKVFHHKDGVTMFL
jgi:hypothetical protein